MRQIFRISTVVAIACAMMGGKIAHGDDVKEAVKRPRDPWVFRSVLDGHARMLTCELSEKLSVAYDTQTCSLYRVWAGGVKFTGGVYDARHGPQPQSEGKPYFKIAADQPSWIVGNGEKNVPQTPHYIGYRVGKNDVTVDYAFAAPGGQRVTVSESPECEINGNRVTLVRTFTLKDLPDGLIVTLNLAGDAGNPPATQSLDNPADGSTGPTTRPTGEIRFDHNGTFRVRTTWSVQ